MLTPLKNVPLHSKQKHFEELFELGEKELLFKTFVASMAKDGEVFATSGKIWISVSHLCFSCTGWKLVVPFVEIKDLKSAGWRTIVVTSSSGLTREITGLWKKDECLELLSSIWWNAPVKGSSLSPKGQPESPVTPEGLVSARKGSLARGSEAASPQSEVVKTLDELDEVADWLLVPSPVAGGTPAESEDQYGFPFENDSLRSAYGRFMESYPKSQERMTARWMSFLQKRPLEQDLLHQSSKEELREMLMRGVPPALRPSVYFRVSGASKKRSAAEPDYFARLLEEGIKQSVIAEWGRTIEKDLLRTYPYHPSFIDERAPLIAPLRNILLAYGVRNRDVRYCQGMNFVCGALLLLFRDVRNEEEMQEKAFWVLCAIVEDLLPSYYSGDMIGSMVDQSVLAFFCEKTMPKVHQHFRALEYPMSLILVKWMNCLFWLNTPSETAARIMDVTMLLGSDALVEFSLGFLAAFQTRICQCEDMHELSLMLDSSMLGFFPTSGNVEKMQAFLGQLNALELTSRRHVGYGMAETRLRAYSTGKALERLRGCVDERKLEAIQCLWDHLCTLSNHKDGLDRDTFCDFVLQRVFTNWDEQPPLLDILFDMYNRSRTGVMNLTEWAQFVEAIESKRGRLKFLYSLCGGTGEPVRIVAVFKMLSEVWGGGADVNYDEVLKVETYSPETFVRLLKDMFPKLLQRVNTCAIKY